MASLEIDEGYFTKLRLTCSEKFFEFDPSRPPKRLDIVKFIFSRTMHHLMSGIKAERLAYKEIVKLWQSFGAQPGDILVRNTILLHLNKINVKFMKWRKSKRDLAKMSQSKQLQRFQEMKSYLETVFSPFPTPSQKTTIFPSFKEWEQKQPRLGMDLNLSVLKIPSFDDFLHGNASSLSWIGAERVEPSKAICPLVKSEDVCEAYMDNESVSRASSSNSYTLPRECFQCGNHGSTRPLKDQAIQTMTEFNPFIARFSSSGSMV